MQLYQDIFHSLNTNHQDKVASLPRESNFEYSEVRAYFEVSTRIKTIKCYKLNPEDSKYLQSINISLAAINKSFRKSVRYINGKLTVDPRSFQLLAIRDGFIYTLCPWTGKILKSNQSIFVRSSVVYYRFVGEKVFYLVVSNLSYGFIKSALYIPDNDIVIRPLYDADASNEEIIQLKSLMVTHSKDVYEYLRYQELNKDNKSPIVVTMGCINFAHHIWNELSGLYRLYEHKLLDNLDKIILFREPLGKIEEIFPEIPSEKIERIFSHNDISQKNIELSVINEVFQQIIKNKYFVISVGDSFIKNRLAERVYQVAYNNSSPQLIEKIEQAKNTYSPLLWISVRTIDRSWVNQVEALSMIIRTMAKDYPKLGVVIDGFCFAADVYSSPTPFGKAIVENDQEKAQQIVVNLSDLGIGIFNIVGCCIWETNLWAHAIDFYFTSHGTVQHKVGWLANKPGVVHTNRKTLNISRFHTLSARESGVEPIYIEEKYIQDVETTLKWRRPENRKAEYNDYEMDWQPGYKELLKLARSNYQNSSAKTSVKKQLKSLLLKIMTWLDFSKL